jgi:hypothetical protein
MDNVIRQALADLHVLRKVVDNKHAERIDETIERLLNRKAHDEHVMQLSGVLLRLAYERNRCECSPVCGMSLSGRASSRSLKLFPFGSPT